MPRVVPRSLLQRVGVMMAVISALAVAGILTSVIIAEMLRGESAAINQSGSLRMQAYRVLSAAFAAPGNDSEAYRKRVLAAQQQFEARLGSPRLVRVLPPAGSGGRLRAVYEGVVAHWHGRQKPAIQAYVDARLSTVGETALSKAAFDASLARGTDDFVGLIDYMVRLLEEDAERKIGWLRLVESVSLLLTLILAVAIVYLIQRGVLRPLKDLLACAERARGGDLSARARHVGEDELGRLGRAFNAMAADLSKLYGDLEARVAEKTAELTRSNRSLELLYRALARLSQYPMSAETYTALLGEVQKVLGFSGGTLCTAGDSAQRADIRVSTLAAGVTCPDACTPAECAFLGTDGVPAVMRSGGRQFLPVRLADREQVYGVMLLELPPAMDIELWQVQLAEAVGRHIGMAIGTERRITQGRRMALLEERSVIARELHDSLAQSLSYLKIQVSRLQAALAESGRPKQAQAIVEELREALNAAYRQLRELLTTFRTQIDGRGLRRGLEQTVDEFRNRGDTQIDLSYGLRDCPMSVNEETHVLHIVREALANLVRHARAHHARVSLEHEGSGGVRVSVEDDGVGIPSVGPRANHYGLAIMRERARSLGGDLVIEPLSLGGTRVLLRFNPGDRPDCFGAAADRCGTRD